jgi:hypothetical protein
MKVSVDEISPLVIRHSVYAAAIKLNKDAGDPSVWTDEDIRNAAKGYFGACDATQVIGGDEVVVHYCDDIISKYNKYRA